MSLSLSPPPPYLSLSLSRERLERRLLLYLSLSYRNDRSLSYLLALPCLSLLPLLLRLLLRYRLLLSRERLPERLRLRRRGGLRSPRRGGERLTLRRLLSLPDLGGAGKREYGGERSRGPGDGERLLRSIPYACVVTRVRGGGAAT